MTRWIITALAAAVITALSAAPGCASTGVGDPCTPDEEYTSSFQGFSISDVSIESKSYVCLSRLCLVNHFQGRVTCPYGQAAPNAGYDTTPPPSGSPAAATYSNVGCGIPGTVPSAASGYLAAGETAACCDTDPPSCTGGVVCATNASIAGFTKGQVPPQVVGAEAADRTANKTVYCSCRCANVEGNTNDGAVYCACPENYTCTQLVTSIATTGTMDVDPFLSGSYCVLNGTAYNPALPTSQTCTATVTSPGFGYCPTQF